MIHPLELQRRNMIEYQQIDNQGNELFKKNGKSKMPDYLNNLFMEEYKEGLKAQGDISQLKQTENIFSEKFQKQITMIAKENLGDADGDMLICIGGGKIPIECMKKLNSKPFKKDNISVIQPVEKVIASLNEATTPFEKAVILYEWNKFINAIINAIAENNLARILRDENGDPITDENEKIMRKDMHPDLKPFIL